MSQNLLGCTLGLGQGPSPLSPEQQWPETRRQLAEAFSASAGVRELALAVEVYHNYFITPYTSPDDLL